MFRRSSPDKPSAPPPSTGFKLGDYILDFFQGPNFTDTRSPDPSPMSSPIRDGAARLADFLGFGSPKRPTSPTPARRPDAKPNTAPTIDSKPIPPRRKYNKHHPPKKDAHRRPRIVPQQHRGPQLKNKRNLARTRSANAHERRMAQASGDLTYLRETAETLMTPDRMTKEDHIFLTQLRKLEVDQKVEHDLERFRAQMARAAGEAEERRKKHEAMDAEAEKLWAEGQDEDALAEQQRKIDAFVRANDPRRLAEEKAVRADEERQRAHQAAERKIREEQERLYRKEQARKAKEEERRKQDEERRKLEEEERRAREDMQRRRREREQRQRELQELEIKIREEIEYARRTFKERWEREHQAHKEREEANRLRKEAREREERERRAREEQERQARLRSEQARRASEEEQIRHHFFLYEGKWNELRTNHALTSIQVWEMPWPVLGIVRSADQITYQDVRAFLFHPLRPGVEGKTPRDKVKSEVLRFHPDKFNTRVVPKVVPSHQAVAQEIAGAIARILTTIMMEEVE